MFSLELEDSDRLVNLFSDGLQRNWMASTGLLEKNGASLDIGFNDLVVFSVFLVFPKKEKLIDTGFLTVGFSLDVGLITYWTVWFSWILNAFDQSTSDTKVYCG